MITTKELEPNLPRKSSYTEEEPNLAFLNICFDSTVLNAQQSPSSVSTGVNRSVQLNGFEPNMQNINIRWHGCVD